MKYSIFYHDWWIKMKAAQYLNYLVLIPKENTRNEIPVKWLQAEFLQIWPFWNPREFQNFLPSLKPL